MMRPVRAESLFVERFLTEANAPPGILKRPFTLEKDKLANGLLQCISWGSPVAMVTSLESQHPDLRRFPSHA